MKYYKAEVVAVLAEEAHIKIHWPGRSTLADEWVGADRIHKKHFKPVSSNKKKKKS